MRPRLRWDCHNGPINFFVFFFFFFFFAVIDMGILPPCLQNFIHVVRQSSTWACGCFSVCNHTRTRLSRTDHPEGSFERFPNNGYDAIFPCVNGPIEWLININRVLVDFCSSSGRYKAWTNAETN